MLENSLNLRKVSSRRFSRLSTSLLYTIILLPKGEGTFFLDSGEYKYSEESLICLSPTQKFRLETESPCSATLLEFHGDFYCIEYHKEEVACNGLLFNNIFLTPVIDLNKIQLQEISALFGKIENEIKNTKTHDRAVLTAYLQLVLALSSRIKRNQVDAKILRASRDKEMEKFKSLVDDYFLKLSKPSDYARILKIDGPSLTKKSQKVFGKSPSNIIQERIVLEAKKLLHLTHKSVKEVAFTLNFKDEHYFSRFFKKQTGFSPVKYREKVGISIVADLSKD